MARKDISKYLNPWMFKREKKRQRLAELRQRDGDNCWRCKRPMRFDLPSGNDFAPTLEPVGPKPAGTGGLGHLCLCHVRCNGISVDNTSEVQERMRRRAEEAALTFEARKGASNAP